jgi:hypothetical protein
MSRLMPVGAIAIIVTALFVLAPGAQAYERYNGGCQSCHGSFTDGTSTKGSTFPSNDKHTMHRSSSNMNTDCDLCHTLGDGRDPWIGSSDGTNDTPGLGCNGCHNNFGLRAHHADAGVTLCAPCHTADGIPPAEYVLPPYYGSPDTDIAMPCNGDASLGVNENWTTNDFIGIDNDGDGFYDMLDLDCSGTPSEIKDLLVLAHDPGTRIVTVGYDNLVCKVTENNFYSGPLSQVAGHNYSAQDCSIGTSGTYNMAYADGSESTFFLIVGKDSGVEGSYGKYGAAIPPTAERPESGLCIEGQDLTNPCDQIP